VTNRKNIAVIAVLIILFVITISYLSLLAAPSITGMFAHRICSINGTLPDFSCTPGDVFNVTAEQVCTPGYSSSVRDVSQELKNRVYAEYGIASHMPYEYEIDHFIALELGGSNDIKNLWPQPGEPRPGYREKIKVDNFLHNQVCKHGMPLAEAQAKVRNWTAIFPEANKTK